MRSTGIAGSAYGLATSLYGIDLPRNVHAGPAQPIGFPTKRGMPHMTALFGTSATTPCTRRG
jgi:hypothetical protein